MALSNMHGDLEFCHLQMVSWTRHLTEPPLPYQNDRDSNASQQTTREVNSIVPTGMWKKLNRHEPILMVDTILTIT